MSKRLSVLGRLVAAQRRRDRLTDGITVQGLAGKQQDELLKLIVSTDMARAEVPETTSRINGLIDEVIVRVHWGSGAQAWIGR